MSVKSTILFLSLLFLLASPVAAEEASAPSAEPAQEAAAAVNVNNKTCPVSSHAVGSMGEGVDVEHNGKIYQLCCMGCIRDFNKDPQKYARLADAMAAQAEEAEDHSAHQH